MPMYENDYATRYQDKIAAIIGECKEALSVIPVEQTAALIKAVLEAEQVFFVGVGRVLLSLKAIAKRWAHLGIRTHIVGEITEPAITSKDILIVGSGSGESLIPVAIAKKAAELGASIVYIGSNAESTVAQLAALTVRVPVRTKLEKPDEIMSSQPMTSLFEQTLLLYGDAVAMMLVEEQNITLKDLWKQHANLE
jgi:6-phospho-3-hexuloisomerase